MNKPITLWYQQMTYEKDGKRIIKFPYNHYEDGYSDRDKPTPKFESQKRWLTAGWRKKIAYMTDDMRIVKQIKENG